MNSSNSNTRTGRDDINLDDLLRGNYDLDTLLERADDIKAALLNPPSRYPYTSPQVRESLRTTVQAIKGGGGTQSKFTDILRNDRGTWAYTLQQIDNVKLSFTMMRDLGLFDTDQAMLEHVEVVLGGLEKYRSKVMEITQRGSNARAP